MIKYKLYEKPMKNRMKQDVVVSDDDVWIKFSANESILILGEVISGEFGSGKGYIVFSEETGETLTIDILFVEEAKGDREQLNRKLE